MAGCVINYLRDIDVPKEIINMANIKQVLSFILNEAGERDIQAVKEALNRREQRSSGIASMDVRGMARQTAANINGQMGLDRGQIRDMVRDFAVKIISQNAPELNEEQVKVLLNNWVPDAPNESVPNQRIPLDTLQIMIRQFLSYSMNEMSITEQEKLHKEMPDWYERYWKMFPDNIQYVLKDYIEGRISREEYQVRIDDILNTI